MNNIQLTTLSLSEASSSISFYVSYEYCSYDNIARKSIMNYKFKSSDIDERESKINIYLDDCNHSYRTNYFNNLDNLLDNYIESYIDFLNKNILSISEQNIFSLIFNKQKNNNLIADLKSKIDHLNTLLSYESKSNIDERFKFMQKHFDFAFVKNNHIESLDHSSFFINVFEPINIGDSIFSIKKNNSTLINLKVLNKSLNFKLNLMHRLEERPFQSYLKATIADIQAMKSEDFYSFEYALQDINTKEAYTLKFDHLKNKYVLKNKYDQEQEFFFTTYEDCLSYINNQKEKLTKLQTQINEAFV